MKKKIEKWKIWDLKTAVTWNIFWINQLLNPKNSVNSVLSTGETDIDECEVDKIDCGGRGYCINTHGSYR